jgi:hypothetical protein
MQSPNNQKINQLLSLAVSPAGGGETSLTASSEATAGSKACDGSVYRSRRVLRVCRLDSCQASFTLDEAPIDLLYGLREIVIHPCFQALLSISVNR